MTMNDNSNIDPSRINCKVKLTKTGSYFVTALVGIAGTNQYKTDPRIIKPARPCYREGLLDAIDEVYSGAWLRESES